MNVLSYFFGILFAANVLISVIFTITWKKENVRLSEIYLSGAFFHLRINGFIRQEKIKKYLQMQYSALILTLRAQLEQNDVDDSLKAAKARSTLKNVPILWWSGPATQPPNLGVYLKNHNFSYQ